jgi:imidazolonepropionase-like amidohydrolase
MRPFSLLSVIALTLSAAAAAVPRAQTAPALVFQNVNVIPMDRERVLRGQTVLIEGARIAGIGPPAYVRIPPGATIVDATGKFLIPGLAEMHAHIPGGDAPDEAMERVLFLYVANGITTARGMLGHPRHLPLRDRLLTGQLLGPTLYTSGPSLNGNSIPTPEAATRAVEEQYAAGYDFLKIHPGVSRPAFDALAAAADRVGIRFAGHVPLGVGLARALEARYASIDHLDGYIEALVKDGAPVSPSQSQFFGVNLVDHLDESRIPALVAETRKAGVAIVPTETLFINGLGPDDPEAMAQWPEMRYVAPQQLADWVANKKKTIASGQPTPAQRARFLDVRRRLLAALYAGGVPIVLGSDAPQVWNVPGFSIHRELAAMVAAGLTPYQALELGTHNVAVYFKDDERTGTVIEGKRADLVLLDANPLASIANSATIAGVVAGGRWVPREEIEQGLEKRVGGK